MEFAVNVKLLEKVVRPSKLPGVPHCDGEMLGGVNGSPGGLLFGVEGIVAADGRISHDPCESEERKSCMGGRAKTAH